MINKLIPDNSELIELRINPSFVLYNTYFYDNYVEEKDVIVNTKLLRFFRFNKKTKKITTYNNVIVVSGTLCISSSNTIVKELSDEEINKLKNNSAIDYHNIFNGKKQILLGSKVDNHKWELKSLPSLCIRYRDIKTGDIGISEDIFFSDIDKIKKFLLFLIKEKYIDDSKIYINDNGYIIDNLKEYIKNYGE